MTYELHPLCTLFPRLSGAEFAALRDDIAANGQRQPIILHEGMILDGGNRYRACLDAGVQPMFEEFAGGNLVAFVLSANLHRRHMSAGQQAAIVASAQDWAKAQPARRPGKGGNVAPLSTVADRAAQSGASERTQKMADKVAKADPVLAKKVAHGEISLPKAVEQIAPRKSVAPEPVQAPTIADDAHEGTDVIDELERENKTLQAQVAALSKGDTNAELTRYVRMYEDAQRKQSELMDKVARRDRELQKLSDLLRRVGKAVGEEDPRKVALAVESMVKNQKVAA